MSLVIKRDLSAKMKHIVTVRDHPIVVDEPESNGGDDLGPTPHELYDSAIGACTAMTMLWYAKRKQIPVEDIEVDVASDSTEERQGTYRLRLTISLSGPLSEEQRQELFKVAAKCPVHRLMTQVKTEISAVLV